MFLAALAAYAFSRMRFRGRRPGLLGLLLVQMFPQLLAIVALFSLMVSIGSMFPSIGFGSQIGLVLIYLGGAMGMNVWLMKGFFDTVPDSLDKSAQGRRCRPRQDLLHDHRAARAADPRR